MKTTPLTIAAALLALLGATALYFALAAPSETREAREAGARGERDAPTMAHRPASEAGEEQNMPALSDKAAATPSDAPLYDDEGKLVKIEKSEEEWRALLSDQQFRVMREKGTERAFTGELWDNKAAGTYHCAGCGLALFSSEHKYESGTGWPSYYDVVDPRHVAEKDDRSFFMTRTEVLCARCDAHLGHVFNDGPEPTGLRYCINSASLVFEPGG